MKITLDSEEITEAVCEWIRDRHPSLTGKVFAPTWRIEGPPTDKSSNLFFTLTEKKP